MSELVLGLAIGCSMGIIIGWIMAVRSMNDVKGEQDEQ